MLSRMDQLDAIAQAIACAKQDTMATIVNAKIARLNAKMEARVDAMGNATA